MRFHSTVDNQRSTFAAKRPAFTLIELLVVVGIIAVLASILFPVISKVREAARETDTRALISSLEAAAQSYKQDFNAFPGPLPTNYITATDQINFGYVPAGWRTGDTGIGERVGTTSNAPGFNTGTVSSTGVVAPGDERVTQAENFLLGLLGGVSVNKATQGQFFLEFDASTVGQGASNLNPVRPGKGTTYMQAASISNGKFRVGDNPAADDALNPTKDSRIPEFVDRWPEPMPILVLRARTGGRAVSQTLPAAYSDTNNNVVVNAPFDSSNPGAQAALNGQYNLVEITPYTQSSIGTAGKLKETDYKPQPFDRNLPHGLKGVSVAADMQKAFSDSSMEYPYNAFAYLADPSSYDTTKTVASEKGKMKARKQDTLILISAGRDRVYGTADDVANFGSVLP